MRRRRSARLLAHRGNGSRIACATTGDHGPNQAYRNRIDRQHVDFLLCHPETVRPLLGIELDDRSHQRADRRERDTFVEGVYRGRARPFCLPRERAEENLVSGNREAAMATFRRAGIKWHDGQDDKSSNHLCDSQVCCANFLAPFAREPEALAALLRSLYADVRRVQPMEEAGEFMSFEWIGAENYLGERVPRNGQRTRGANFPSADAAVMFEWSDGERQIVLIEWKVTESYAPTPLHRSSSGTDRTAIYHHLFEREDFPLDKAVLPGFDDLFYEPFYQLMRQQSLANEMERAGELGASRVSLLHIAPAANKAFQRVTSPGLRPLGKTVTSIWRDLQKQPDRFHSVSTEALFGALPVAEFPQQAAWWAVVTERYAWLVA